MITLSPPPALKVPRQQPQVEKTKRSMDKKVSWAAGKKLCRVRFFVAEDAPAMSGYVQGQLQTMQARNLHIFNTAIPMSAPHTPGFGGVAVKSQPDHMALGAIVPQISWRQPSAVPLNPTWHVMAGEASLESGLQKQREDRILEVFYPHQSSIPANPAEPVEAQEPYDDKNTPQVPLVPLEEGDLSDESPTPSWGPRFLSQGSSGQVAGVHTNSLPDGRPEKVEQYIREYVGNNLPVPIREISNARKNTSWRDASVVSTATTSPVDPSSNVLSSRPSPAIPITGFHSNFKQTGIEPDAQAAAPGAFNALSMILVDNELLMQILRNPGLIHALTAKSPFAIPTNSKVDLPASTNLNGVSRRPGKIIQAQAINGIADRANHWINLPSTSSISMPAGGQEGNGSTRNQSYIYAGDRFQKTQGSEDSPSTLLPGTVRNGQQFTDPTNGGRVGLGKVPRPSKSSDAQPSFGSSITNGSGIMPQSFSDKTTPRGGEQTGATQTGAVSSKPLPRRDEQYFKSLIIQYGSANDGDPARAVIDEGYAGARLGNIYNTPDAKRWYGTEQLKTGRQPGRNKQQRRQENERIGAGSGVETAVPRAKSRKVCIYFGTPRGCRTGDDCTFIHMRGDTEKRIEKLRTAPPQQVPFAKRLKLDG